MIDLRDLLYYLSLCAFFLLLTVYTLDRKRWGSGAAARTYRRNASTGMALLGANLLVLNLWLAPLAGLRWDATAQQEYTLTQTTKDLLGSLQEPLLIRAYISSKSHPLLDPLRPQVEDLLREYAIAGKGRVTTEVVDPAQDPALEAEANQTYGIQPTPFQVSDRYQASVINAYFDILVRYGDQDVVLNFRDLIQVEQNPEGGVDVRLQQPRVRPDQRDQEGALWVPEHRHGAGVAGAAAQADAVRHPAHAAARNWRARRTRSARWRRTWRRSRAASSSLRRWIRPRLQPIRRSGGQSHARRNWRRSTGSSRSRQACLATTASICTWCCSPAQAQRPALGVATRRSSIRKTT